MLFSIMASAPTQTIRAVTLTDEIGARLSSLKSTNTRVVTNTNKKGKTMKVTQGVFDSESMETITLEKTIPDVVVTSIEEELVKLKNDPEQLKYVLQKGLEANARAAAKNDPTGWIDSETEKPYEGTPLDDSKVRMFINTIAKMKNYSASLPKDQRKAIKEAAKAEIFSTPAMREIVANNCKITAEE